MRIWSSGRSLIAPASTGLELGSLCQKPLLAETVECPPFHCNSKEADMSCYLATMGIERSM